MSKIESGGVVARLHAGRDRVAAAAGHYTGADLQRLLGMSITDLGFAMRRGDLPMPARRDGLGLPLWDRPAIDTIVAERRGRA